MGTVRYGNVTPWHTGNPPCAGVWEVYFANPYPDFSGWVEYKYFHGHKPSWPPLWGAGANTPALAYALRDHAPFHQGSAPNLWRGLSKPE